MPDGVGLSRDGQRLLAILDGHVVNGTRDRVRIWEVAGGQSRDTPLSDHEGVEDAEFSPNGKRVVTKTVTGGVRIWDAALGEPLTAMLTHDGAVSTSLYVGGFVGATPNLQSTASGSLRPAGWATRTTPSGRRPPKLASGTRSRGNRYRPPSGCRDRRRRPAATGVA